jgi:hypothetical protein
MRIKSLKLFKRKYNTLIFLLIDNNSSINWFTGWQSFNDDNVNHRKYLLVIKEKDFNANYKNIIE